MSVMPAFELGLWNAWVFMVPALLVLLLCFLVMTKKDVPGGPARVACKSKATLLVASLSKFIYFPAVIYSVFLPIELGTIWFYVGLPICLLALVIGFSSVVSFNSTPLDRLVTRGTYRISRNPICLAGFLLDLGIGLACASWVFVLYAMVDLVLMNTMLKAEERFLLEKYGDAYKEYMSRTPKWIGIPRSRRNDINSA